MKGLGRSFVMCLILFGVVPAQADGPVPESQAADQPSLVSRIGTKFLRGAANFATGWVEFPKQIYLVGQQEGWLAGAIRGPIDGLGWFVARTVGGAYEVLTFPLPIPLEYRPLFTPEYVWQPIPTEPVLPTSGLTAAGQTSDSGPASESTPSVAP